MKQWIQGLLDRVMARIGYYRPDDEDENDQVVGAFGILGQAKDGEDDEVLSPPPTMFASGPFGTVAGRPFDSAMIPDDAQSAKWESKHLFTAYSPRPTRTPWGLQCSEPPLALACPDCDYRQSVLHPGFYRRCRYCGVHMATHGTRIYWWRKDPKVVLPDWLQAKGGGR